MGMLNAFSNCKITERDVCSGAQNVQIRLMFYTLDTFGFFERIIEPPPTRRKRETVYEFKVFGRPDDLV